MFVLSKNDNKLATLKQITFSESGLTERKHLQEWIRKSPDILGEELLIIQREFDGFADTNERLDLLALDKHGDLVIIENKLDDSGKDVIWQALKYAAYCSTLDINSLKDIYDVYLRKIGDTKSAQEHLQEFFGSDDYEESLNMGATQRIILVAGEFRKEVTSTVLWLLNNYGLRIQCFKITPYSHNDKVLLSVDQIIPIKDAEEYVISMAQKTRETIEKQTQAKSKQKDRFRFWSKFLEASSIANNVFSNNSPTDDSWLGSGLGMSGINLNVVVSRNYARAEIYINRGSQEENKLIFNLLHDQKMEIEASFGDMLNWERMEDKVTSRIKYQKDEVNVFDEEDWTEMIKFLLDVVPRMEKAFRKPVQNVRNNLPKVKN